MVKIVRPTYPTGTTGIPLVGPPSTNPHYAEQPLEGLKDLLGGDPWWEQKPHTDPRENWADEYKEQYRQFLEYYQQQQQDQASEEAQITDSIQVEVTRAEPPPEEPDLPDETPEHQTTTDPLTDLVTEVTSSNVTLDEPLRGTDSVEAAVQREGKRPNAPIFIHPMESILIGTQRHYLKQGKKTSRYDICGHVQNRPHHGPYKNHGKAARLKQIRAYYRCHS